MSHQQTTAEQLGELRKIVSWVLWKVATDDPESDIPFRGYSIGEISCIQSHAEELFKDPAWVSNVVGGFAANHAGTNTTKEWDAWVERMEEKP